LKVEFIKQEVELRVLSIKEELDKIQDKFMAQIDTLRNEMVENVLFF
jgi:hypothetical protein